MCLKNDHKSGVLEPGVIRGRSGMQRLSPGYTEPPEPAVQTAGWSSLAGSHWGHRRNSVDCRGTGTGAAGVKEEIIRVRTSVGMKRVNIFKIFPFFF